MSCEACTHAQLQGYGIANEVFSFTFRDLGFEVQWCIGAVMRYIVDERKTPDTLMLENMLPWLERVEIVAEHIWHVPADLPIIVVTMKDGSSVVIDGNHRVARALAEGRESIKAFFLTETEVEPFAVRYELT